MSQLFVKTMFLEHHHFISQLLWINIYSLNANFCGFRPYHQTTKGISNKRSYENISKPQIQRSTSISLSVYPRKFGIWTNTPLWDLTVHTNFLYSLIW
jgi:hypothetical protein